MSLDVYLELDQPIRKKKGTGIFVREGGQRKELASWAEWYDRNPNREPVLMKQKNPNDEFELTTEAWHGNITHNLGKMARECNAYSVCWEPESLDITQAKQAKFHLANALMLLKSEPDRFKQFNPANGWGNYELLLNFLQDYLNACNQYPEATIVVSR